MCIIMKEEESSHCVATYNNVHGVPNQTQLDAPYAAYIHQPDIKRFQVTHPIMSLAASQQLGGSAAGIITCIRPSV